MGLSVLRVSAIVLGCGRSLWTPNTTSAVLIMAPLLNPPPNAHGPLWLFGWRQALFSLAGGQYGSEGGVRQPTVEA